MKYLAEELAEQVPGVHEVDNQIRVRKSGMGQGERRGMNENDAH